MNVVRRGLLRPVTDIANTSIDFDQLGVHVMNFMEDFALDESMVGPHGRRMKTVYDPIPLFI